MSEPAASASMILGPVFHAELVTTSRRRRYYFARLVYGLALLAIVGWTYEEARRELAQAGGATAPGFAPLAEVAAILFTTFLSAQVAAVLCLAPAMVAGSIAEEKQRKTLPYLLASRLSGVEIVVGKLAARLLQLVALVLTGLPIMSILSLFGGLDPPLVVAAFAGTLTTTFALAGLAIFVSALTRRARDAIVAAYILELLWLGAPTIAGLILGPMSPEALTFLERVAAPIAWLDPFQLTDLARPTPDLPVRLARMAGLQVALGLAFVGLAVWRLRPSSANSERGRSAESWRRPATAPGAAKRPGLVARVFGRPPVGDDPMAWKERHVARAGPVLRSIGMLSSVFSVIFLGDVLLDLGRPAFAELAEYGYGDAPVGVVHKARDELEVTVALAAASACILWIVGVAVTTAAGLPSEREDDTWISLLGTALTGGEILRGKALGALWRWRAAGMLALFLWTFGLVGGAIHPLGYLLTLALFATYTAFALALGSFVSLRARSTTRAMVATVAVLFVLNGGYLMCLFPVVGRLDALWLSAPLMPYVIDLAPERHSAVQALFGTFVDNYRHRLDAIIGHLLTCLVSLVGYGLAASALGVAAIDGFDRVADRPRRPPGYSAALAEAIGAESESVCDESAAVEIGPDA